MLLSARIYTCPVHSLGYSFLAVVKKCFRQRWWADIWGSRRPSPTALWIAEFRLGSWAFCSTSVSSHPAYQGSNWSSMLVEVFGQQSFLWYLETLLSRTKLKFKNLLEEQGKKTPSLLVNMFPLKQSWAPQLLGEEESLNQEQCLKVKLKRIFSHPPSQVLSEHV